LFFDANCWQYSSHIFHGISYAFPYLNQSGGASRALQAAIAEIQATVQQSLERTLRTKTTWSSTKTRATGRSSENEEWDGCWIYISVGGGA
jgi:hypothetical protein